MENIEMKPILFAAHPTTWHESNKRWIFILSDGNVRVSTPNGMDLISLANLSAGRLSQLAGVSLKVYGRRLIVGNYVIFDMNQILGFISKVGFPQEIETTFGKIETFKENIGRIGYVHKDRKMMYFHEFGQTIGFLEELLTGISILIGGTNISLYNFDERIFLFRIDKMTGINGNEKEILFHWENGKIEYHDTFSETYLTRLIESVEVHRESMKEIN